MKKFIVFLAFFLTACGGSTTPQGTPTATPNPAEIALQMFQQQVASGATQQIVELQFTATAQVIAATAAQQANMTMAAETAQARQDLQATAQKEEENAQATAQKSDMLTATQQSIDYGVATEVQRRKDDDATQVAAETSTSIAITKTAIPTSDYLTSIWNQSEIELKNNEVELSNLAVQQQSEKNTWDWAYPIGVSAVMVVAFLLYVKEHGRVREIKNADGDIETIIFNNEKMITPRLMPKPLLMLQSGDMPDVTDHETQKEIVKRAQAIEALGNLPVNPSPAGVAAFNGFFSEPVKPAQPFEIVEGDAIPAGMLDVEGIKAIEKDWKDANDQ